MPYRSIAELPERVRGALPHHAQQVYREAFNIAWEECAGRGEEREGNAHRYAWKRAIKKKYGKENGH